MMLQSNRSLMWILILVPAGLLFGWFLVQLPYAKPHDRAAAPANGQTATSAVPAATRPTASAEGSTGANVPANAASGAGASKAAGSERERAPEPPEVSAWTTFDDAMAESKRTGKPVFVDFNAEWCGPCMAMKSQLFEDESMNQTLQTTVIPVSVVDRAREDGSNSADVDALQKRFEVEAFPTLVVISARTGRSVKSVGFAGAVRTLSWVQESAEAVR